MRGFLIQSQSSNQITSDPPFDQKWLKLTKLGILPAFGGKCYLIHFNPQKCKIMHYGSSDSSTNYVMKEISGVQTTLNATSVEKDLGVYVTNNLKPTTHCLEASNKAISALMRRIIRWILKRTFDLFDLKKLLILYFTCIRPHPEHDIQAVGPYMS